MTTSSSNGAASAGPFFDALARLSNWITHTCLIGLVLLVCAEALLRSTINFSLGFAEEVTAYMVVMLTFSGAALAVRNHALFRVEFLFDRFSHRTKMILTWAFGALALAVCVVLAWKTMDLTLSSWNRGKFAPTVLKTPLWIPQMLMPIGFALIIAFVVERMLLARCITANTDYASSLD